MKNWRLFCKMLILTVLGTLITVVKKFNLEFLTAAQEKQTMLSKENLETAFRMMDIDKSGTITLDELKLIFGNRGN